MGIGVSERTLERLVNPLPRDHPPEPLEAVSTNKEDSRCV